MNQVIGEIGQRNRTSVAILGFVLLSILFACSREQPLFNESTSLSENVNTAQDTNGADASAVTITFAVYPQDFADYAAYARQFEANNPEIKVRVVGTNELLEGTQTSTADLARVADIVPYIPYFEPDTTALLDLQPLLETAEFHDDFQPGLLPNSGEPIYGLPTGVKYPVIFFSRSAFDTANLPYPQDNWTLEQFVDTAVALTQHTNDGTNQWGYVADQWRISPLLSTQLTQPIRGDFASRLADEDVVTALTWAKTLLSTQQVAPWLDYYRLEALSSQTSDATMNPYALMSGGQAAMWQRPHNNFAEYDDVGVVAIPHAPDAYAADPIQSGFALSRGTQHPDAALAFLDYLTRQPPIDNLASWTVPARQSVAEATDFWDKVPAPLASSLRYAVEHTVSARLDAQSAEALLTILTHAIDEEMTIAEATTAYSGLPELTVTPSPEPFMVPTTVAPPENEVATYITFMAGLINKATLTDLAETYMQQNPDIVLTIIERDDSYHSKPLAVQVAEAEVDCFISWGQDLPTEVLAPLSPYFEIDTELNEADFYPLAFQAMIRDDEIYGIPGAANVGYMQYNRSFFLENGIAEPASDWNIEQFLDLMQQITTHEDGRDRYGYVDPSGIMASQARTMLGIQTVIVGEEGPEYNLDGVETAVRWMIDLQYLYEIMPIFPPLGGEDTVRQVGRMVNEGEAIFWPHFLTDSLLFFDIPVEAEIGTVPYPSVNGGIVYDLAAEGRLTAYHIAANSNQKGACWDWIKFLAVQPTQAIESKWMPAHIAASQDPAFVDTVGAVVAEVFYAALTSNQHRVSVEPVPEWMTPISFWVRDAYEEAQQNGDVTAAMTELRDRYATYRECVLLNNGTETYDLWRDCAVSIDPSLSRTFQ